jgi:ABC-2 type transport system ATP-binding protein
MNGEPMIQVEHLTKRYGRHAAVDDISFTVARGEIVGLLGRNGAGKSTVLRILSCFMPATAGTTRVAGLDVFRDADAVRARIGYMPENNPLPAELRVREYLRFRARLKRLGARASQERVAMVTEQCGLGEVSGRIIGTLSKGYRQRVGLADALVHAPELVILDEPTIGLDPHQIRTVRQLIKELGRDRTVLLSSHILSEVEMTCDRVLILHAGRIVAADTAANLAAHQAQAGVVITEVAGDPDALRACWAALETVEQFTIDEAGDGYYRCRLTPRPGMDPRSDVFEAARLNGWRLRELTRNRHSLEDTFVHITRGEVEHEEEEG